MGPQHRGLFEPNAPPCLLPELPGTQTDACTYSLTHQFSVARLYRSEVAREWPPGIIQKMYGDGLVLDFFRHPPTFRTTVAGTEARPAEADSSRLLRDGESGTIYLFLRDWLSGIRHEVTATP